MNSRGLMIDSISDLFAKIQLNQFKLFDILFELFK